MQVESCRRTSASATVATSPGLRQGRRSCVCNWRAKRSYWVAEHEDTRDIGRIRAVHDFIVGAVDTDRAVFLKS